MNFVMLNKSCKFYQIVTDAHLFVKQNRVYFEFFTVQSQQKAQIKIGKYCHNVAETEKIQEFRVEKKVNFSQKLYSTS